MRYSNTIALTKKKGAGMDNQKFGAFVSSLRKEKGWTQVELAEHLNVTDKAVSKWERGLGFPDIKLIEPLADALGVSILEIMRSERTNEQNFTRENATEAITNVISVVEYQRKIERRNIIIASISIAVLIMSAFLIDNMEIEGFLMACLPIIMIGIGVFLLVLSIHRKKQKITYTTTLILGILAILFPLLVVMMLYFALSLGGPIPK